MLFRPEALDLALAVAGAEQRVNRDDYERPPGGGPDGVTIPTMRRLSTVLKPLEQVIDRIARARDDSDVAYFYALLNAGELLVKLAIAGLLSCIEDDRERHRYRLEFEVVHADGLGGWSSVLDDALTGPASQVLASHARGMQRELTQTLRARGTEWQPQAIGLLYDASIAVDASTAPLPAKVAGRRWFSDFTTLRNRTRGHGATTPAACSGACGPLHDSIKLIVDNLTIFRLPWVHLRRNLSGKYRVIDLGNGTKPFDHLKVSRDQSLVDGVYIWSDGPRLVSLIVADDDVRDFYLPNGGFNGKHYELLSYNTDSRTSAGASDYADPPTVLPASETQGGGELEVIGNVFANLPTQATGYVRRETLEDDLKVLLTDDRHPVVTLGGRGGIGKTSLALAVLHDIAQEDRFFSIIWFSARDIELLPNGPKLVRPHVLSPDDMAREYVELTSPAEGAESNFRPLSHFAEALAENSNAPTLFVFDNFETVRSPLELYRWLDTYIRIPNKILITTRNREFKGDYWIEVGGMTEDQFAELVEKTAREVGVHELIDAPYLAELYQESDGHPYIAKVLLGELARSGKQRKIARILASQDRVLEALFERTFTQLAPGGQRVFLTLSSWHSLVPLVALAAAVNRPDNERMDVESAVDELRRASLIEITTTPVADVYLRVPLSAALFGARKLGASPWEATVEADTEILRLFGVVQPSGTRHGLEAQVVRLFENVADRLQKRPDEFERYRPVLEFVSREQPLGWTLLAQLLEEYRPSGAWLEDVADAYRRYLEVVPNDGQIWRALAGVCRGNDDFLGAAHALVRRAQLPDAPYADVSYAANRVNGDLADHLLKLDTDEKHILVQALVDVMSKRKDEANATDLSRLAWLLVTIDQRKEAKQVVQAGLELEPTNPHCRKLAERLKVRSPKAGVATAR